MLNFRIDADGGIGGGAYFRWWHSEIAVILAGRQAIWLINRITLQWSRFSDEIRQSIEINKIFMRASKLWWHISMFMHSIPNG